jgi:beta-N-acetylhexosaminidase
VRTGLEVIASLRALYPDAFTVDRPQHFDALIGNGWVREALERGEAVEAVVRRWQTELEAFAVERKGYLLYD